MIECESSRNSGNSIEYTWLEELGCKIFSLATCSNRIHTHSESVIHFRASLPSEATKLYSSNADYEAKNSNGQDSPSYTTYNETQDFCL